MKPKLEIDANTRRAVPADIPRITAIRHAVRENRLSDPGSEFCRVFDQVAFDPNFKSMPLEAFEPMLQKLFCRPRQSIYVAAAAE